MDLGVIFLAWAAAAVAAGCWLLFLRHRAFWHLHFAPTRRTENPGLYWWLMTWLGLLALVLLGAAVLMSVMPMR